MMGIVTSAMLDVRNEEYAVRNKKREVRKEERKEEEIIGLRLHLKTQRKGTTSHNSSTKLRNVNDSMHRFDHSSTM